jgi:hypothetical protein
MNRALIMVVRAGFLASTIMASPAFADVVIDLDLPENQGRTIGNVPQGTNVTVIGSGAPHPRQLSIQGARDVVVRGGVWKSTAKELSGTIHTKAITGAMTIFGAYINNSAARDGLVPNVDGRARITRQPTYPTYGASSPSVTGGITSVAYTSTIDAEKLQNDIATMQNNGTPANTIKYILSLDGITIPDEVLAGGKSVREAIADGSLAQGGAPTTWTPPIMQPSPTPDLTPHGSSAPNWSSNAAVPTVEQLRQSVMSRPRPPDC